MTSIMSFITKNYLKFIIKDIETLEDINKICESRNEICLENREVLCKKVLQVSGYKVSRQTNSCKIFKELLNLSRITNNKGNIMIMTPELNTLINEIGSDELKIFIDCNYPYRQKIVKKINNSINLLSSNSPTQKTPRAPSNSPK